MEDITISNYYTFTYADADGDKYPFEEKFILLETPRRLVFKWIYRFDDKDREWQLIGEMVYDEDDSTKIISASILLGTASSITSSIGIAYGENVFSSCIGSLIPHTSYTPFYMMVGDTQLNFTKMYAITQMETRCTLQRR